MAEAPTPQRKAPLYEMTAQSELEIKGSFLAHPFADLLAEIAAAGLSGSLRVSEKDRKCVVYFRDGRVIFAVSNARSSRLFDVLLKRDKISKEVLAEVPNFQNDLELASDLKRKNILTEDECNKLFSEQIQAMIVECLTWESGEWAFNHLARAREGLECNVDVTALLVEYGRCMSADTVLNRFSSMEETFTFAGVAETAFQLKPEETFVLTRAAIGTLTAADLVGATSMPQSDALRSIYVLWLGGLLVRGNWRPAFGEGLVRAMREARLEIKRVAKLPGVVETSLAASAAGGVDASPEAAPEPDIDLTVDEYLKRVEEAETYYDILGVDPKAEITELKKAYFALARKFHPDRYHADGGTMRKRVQQAFSELAGAHETLKNPESREIYDYRVRKELAEREQARNAGEPTDGTAGVQFSQASENFERGYTLLMDGEAEAATPFLARARHYAPKNARYRAYYGKALSANDDQRHKAEAEMQAAIKIEPNNLTFRLILAEFFVRHNLNKRAIGELTRLLALDPDHREARDLLARLQQE